MPTSMAERWAGHHDRPAENNMTSSRPLGYPWSCASHFQQLACFRDVRTSPVQLLADERIDSSYESSTSLERRAKRQQISNVLKDYFNGVPPRIVTARLTPAALAGALNGQSLMHDVVDELAVPLPAAQADPIWFEEQSDREVINAARYRCKPNSDRDQPRTTFATARESSISSGQNQADGMDEVFESILQKSSPPELARSVGPIESQTLQFPYSSPCERQSSRKRRPCVIRATGIARRKSTCQVGTTRSVSRGRSTRVSSAINKGMDPAQEVIPKIYIEEEELKASMLPITKATTKPALQDSQTPFMYRRRRASSKTHAPAKVLEPTTATHPSAAVEDEVLDAADCSEASPKTAEAGLSVFRDDVELQTSNDELESTLTAPIYKSMNEDDDHAKSSDAETVLSPCPETITERWAGTQAMLEEARRNLFTQQLSNSGDTEYLISPEQQKHAGHQLVNQTINSVQGTGRAPDHSQDHWSPWSIAKKPTTSIIDAQSRLHMSKSISQAKGLKFGQTPRRSRLRSSMNATSIARSPSTPQLLFPVTKQTSQLAQDVVKGEMDSLAIQPSVLRDHSNPDAICDEISAYIFQNSQSA